MRNHHADHIRRRLVEANEMRLEKERIRADLITESERICSFEEESVQRKHEKAHQFNRELGEVVERKRSEFLALRVTENERIREDKDKALASEAIIKEERERLLGAIYGSSDTCFF